MAIPCPGGVVSMAARVLDPAGWADMLAWLSDEADVAHLFADWEQESQSSERSMTSRLDAAAAQVAVLQEKMGRLAETIAETSGRESRRTLQDKLDAYSEQLRSEEGKREQLLREARDATNHAHAQRDLAQWAQVVAREASTCTREEQ
jgi:hypothetical protein